MYKKNFWILVVAIFLIWSIPVQAISDEEIIYEKMDSEGFEELETIDNINIPDISDAESADELLDRLEKISEETARNESVQKMLELPIVKQLVELIQSLLKSVFQLLFDFIEKI